MYFGARSNSGVCIFYIIICIILKQEIISIIWCKIGKIEYVSRYLARLFFKTDRRSNIWAPTVQDKSLYVDNAFSVIITIRRIVFIVTTLEYVNCLHASVHESIDDIMLSWSWSSITCHPHDIKLECSFHLICDRIVNIWGAKPRPQIAAWYIACACCHSVSSHGESRSNSISPLLLHSLLFFLVYFIYCHTVAVQAGIWNLDWHWIYHLRYPSCCQVIQTHRWTANYIGQFPTCLHYT